MAKGNAQDLFRSKAPWIMALLMRDFKLAVDDTAAIVGNLGHETAGFTAMQEIKPTVPSSRGGYGWPMFPLIKAKPWLFASKMRLRHLILKICHRCWMTVKG